jgi:hypothetical protein
VPVQEPEQVLLRVLVLALLREPVREPAPVWCQELVLLFQVLVQEQAPGTKAHQELARVPARSLFQGPEQELVLLFQVLVQKQAPVKALPPLSGRLPAQALAQTSV